MHHSCDAMQTDSDQKTWFSNKGRTSSHTRVVKIHDAPDDVVNVTTFFVYDVDDVFGLGGKRQHVEIQLYIVTVQLEKK